MDSNSSLSDPPSGLLSRKRGQKEQAQQFDSVSTWYMRGVLSILCFGLRLVQFFLLFHNYNGTLMWIVLSQILQALSLAYSLKENKQKISSTIQFILFYFFFIQTPRNNGYLKRSLVLLPILLSIDSFLFVQYILSTSHQGSLSIVSIIAWSVNSLVYTLHQELEKLSMLSPGKLIIEAAGFTALNNTTIFQIFIGIRNMKLLFVPLNVLLVLALRSTFVTRQFLMCGYKHDSLKSSSNGLLSIFFSQVLFYIGPLKQFPQSPFKQTLEAKMLLVYCIRGIFLILLFGITFSDIMILENNTLLHTIGCYVIVLSIPLWDKVREMGQYLQFGPYYRIIEVNCKDISNQTQEQINQEYFDFKSKQKWVEINVNSADIQGLNKILAIIHQDFNKESSQLQGELPSPNLHEATILKDNISPNSKVQAQRQIKVSTLTPGQLHNHLVIKPETNTCDINLHSIDSLLFAVFNLLEDQFKYPIEKQWIRYLHITRKQSISAAEDLEIFQSILARAYSLVPYVIVPKGDLFHPIKIMQIQILKITALNIHVRSFLNFMPEQIYYDLFS